MFKLLFSSKSKRQIKKLSPEIKEKIKSACEKIAKNPWDKQTIKIKGRECKKKEGEEYNFSTS